MTDLDLAAYFSDLDAFEASKAEALDIEHRRRQDQAEYESEVWAKGGRLRAPEKSAGAQGMTACSPSPRGHIIREFSVPGGWHQPCIY